MANEDYNNLYSKWDKKGIKIISWYLKLICFWDRYLNDFKSEFEDKKMNFDFCAGLVKSLSWL